MNGNKPWLASYPAGVPAEVEIDPALTLVDVLGEAFERHAKRRALESFGRTLSFAQVDDLSRALAAWLQSRGLTAGDRVALMMPNLPQYAVAIAGVLRASGVVVNVNPLYTGRELEHQLKDSGATMIVVLENFAHTVAEVAERTALKEVVLCTMGDLLGFVKGQAVNYVVRHRRKMVPSYHFPPSVAAKRFNMAIAEGTRLNWSQPATRPDDVAFLQYTGGTTGVSKGATLLHRNVVANILQCEAWFRPSLQQLGSAPLTVLCALPLYHIFALTICYLMGARLGMMNLMIANPRDIAGLISTLRRHRVNMIPAVNTLFSTLVNEPSFADLDFSGLVVSNGGGMAVQKATAQRWLQVTGCPIVEGYGLSETSPAVTSNRLDLREFTGTIGLPVPGTDVSIRDEANRAVPCGEAGEICVRGPQVMAGYWNRPDETAQVMTEDGFFRSGDVGVMDERGYIRIVDRKKDMILVSGFNVYPSEIEQVVSLHPGVLECAVVGIPDEKSGEAVKLYVVRRDASLTEEVLAEYCRINFTGYKRPKAIEFRPALPKSNVGKVLRRELREAA